MTPPPSSAERDRVAVLGGEPHAESITVASERSRGAGPVIGFVGLGVMGLPMAENLLRAGFRLLVTTRTPARAAPLLGQGAEWAATAREVGSRTSIVITMLPEAADVETVVEGEDGLIAGATPTTVWIDMSTIDPGVSRRLASAAAARGVQSLDAPVSGGEAAAKEGNLSIMVGGDRDLLDRVRPVLDVLGTPTHIGDNGAGQIAKACNQLVVGVTIAGVAEALGLAAKAGVNPAVVRSALLGGLAHSRILEMHGQRMLDRTYSPGFRSRLHAKDLRIVAALGDECEIGLPLAAETARLLNALGELGGGDEDHAAVARVYESRTGVSIAEAAQ